MNVGDRVIYVGTNRAFADQSKGSAGSIIDMRSMLKSWVHVRWDNGGEWGYPIKDLQIVDAPMQGALEYEDILACQDAMENL